MTASWRSGPAPSNPEYTRMAASAAAGIEKERVRVHVPYADGSFGLHSSRGNDPTTEAVEIARALQWKHPVKVQPLREGEFKSSRYRAMAVHRVRAGSDADGRLTAYHQQIAAQPTSINDKPLVALLASSVDSAEHPVLREFPRQPPGGSSGQPVGISKPATITALLSAAARRRPTTP
jgi:hypothetical protein